MAVPVAVQHLRRDTDPEPGHRFPERSPDDSAMHRWQAESHDCAAEGPRQASARTPPRKITIMSTEEPPAASDSLMESQGAATAGSVPPSGRPRPVLAAVQPPVEAASKPLSFDDFYRREHRHVLGLAASSPATSRWLKTLPRMRSLRHFDTGVPSRPTTRPGHGFDESPAIKRLRWCADECARRRRWCDSPGAHRPPSNWMKAMPRSGKQFVVSHPGKHRRSLSITWRTTACGTSPRFLTAAKAPSKPT